MNKMLLTLICLFFAIFAAAQPVQQKVVNKLMPYIIAELEGTEAKKEIDAFYKTPAFKALGVEPYTLEYSVGDDIVFAQWKHRGGYAMQFMHRAVDLQAKYLEINPQGFLNNKEYMRRFAVCAAPIFVHETMHQKETADMLDMGFATTINPRSEILGYGYQFIYMAQKQAKYPKMPAKYFADCDSLMDYVLNIGLQNDFNSFKAQLANQLNAMRVFPMPQLDRQNVNVLIMQLTRDFGADIAKMETARSNYYKQLLGTNLQKQPVFLTLDDFIVKGRWDWRRAPIEDLGLAAIGKHANFNKYNAWFDAELKKLAEKFKISRDLLLLQIQLKQVAAK